MHFYLPITYDYSSQKTSSIIKPSPLLFDILELKNSSADGEFINHKNEMICFDPSVQNRAIECLLVKKEELLSYLRENKLRIMWTVLGEKAARFPTASTKNNFLKGLEFSAVVTEKRGSISFKQNLFDSHGKKIS